MPAPPRPTRAAGQPWSGGREAAPVGGGAASVIPTGAGGRRCVGPVTSRFSGAGREEDEEDEEDEAEAGGAVPAPSASGPARAQAQPAPGTRGVVVGPPRWFCCGGNN